MEIWNILSCIIKRKKLTKLKNIKKLSEIKK